MWSFVTSAKGNPAECTELKDRPLANAVGSSDHNGHIAPSVRRRTSNGHAKDGSEGSAVRFSVLARSLRSVPEEGLVYTWGTLKPTCMDTIPVLSDMEAVSLEEHVARLEALLEASRQVHSSIAVQDVLSCTLAVLVRELELDGAAVLPAAGGEPLATRGSLPALASADLSLRGSALLARDGSPLARLVLSPGAGRQLNVYEQDFVERLLLQASVALENATLHERDLQWARVQQDLDAARNIQQSLLPRSMPDLPGFSIAGRSSMCFEVGGDYLDVVSLPDGDQLLIVADVAGKGLASAIVATSFRSAFRSLLTQPVPLVEIVTRVGQQHWEEGTEARRRYVTAIFVRLRTQAGEIEVVNAGHNPALLVLPDGAVRLIEASGAPLGLLPGMTYAAETHRFAPGSRLLLYTDGLTEVFCGEDEFGCERLTDAFQHIASPDASEVLDQLWSRLTAFASQTAQTDDMTALAVCHLAPSQQETQLP